MRCEEIMKRDVRFVSTSSTAQEAARIMRDENIGFLPVCDDQKRVLGTLTDRDLAIRLVAENRSSNESVGNVMTKEAICCRTGDDVQMAEQRMASEHKSRIMCVDDSGRLEGVISLSDIAQVTPDERAAKTMRGVTEREAA
ncbi:MAG: CBS domain-containing protein [Polyangiaceae bacterium]|nr:CBS domain-containing protein [Polyangiaceae bacterium]